MTLQARADTLPPARLPALESEVRDWLGRLQFEDPALLPDGEAPELYFRRYRGRLLDVLGWAALRRRDLRQAEAALVSAVEELNSRGTTRGYARHFYHLGDVLAERGRWPQAVAAYLDAEVRGMGGAASPALEAAYRRWRGSLRGLDDLRVRERARVEDERRQLLVADLVRDPLPRFTWPRRAGAPFGSTTLIGRSAVVVLWGPDCAGCPGLAARLAPLARVLQRRGGSLLGVWLGSDPAVAGPPQEYPIVLPPDPEAAGRAFGVGPLPALLVVDSAGWIRYRWSGGEAASPPIDDVVIQIDHLLRRMGR